MVRKGKKETEKNRRGQKWDARFAIAISEKSCLVVINLRAAIKKKTSGGLGPYMQA